MLAFDLCRSWRRTFCPVFLSAVRAVAARCKLPFALLPGLSQEIEGAHQRNYKGKRQRKSGHPLLLVCRCHGGGRGQEQRSSSPAPEPPTAPNSSASASCSSSCSRRSQCSHSDTWLPAPSSSTGGTSLPTSVTVRKSSTAFPHVLSARRSRIFHWLFHLPVSICTSAHCTFCCNFHSGHTLKRWSLVCEGHLHHQHWASGRTLAQCRYCPVRAWPVFSW